jgi:hypothetical protein
MLVSFYLNLIFFFLCFVFLSLVIFHPVYRLFEFTMVAVVNSSVARRSRTVVRKSNLGTHSRSYNFSDFITGAIATTVFETVFVVVFLIASSNDALSVEPLIGEELLLLLLLLLL